MKFLLFKNKLKFPTLIILDYMFVQNNDITLLLAILPLQ